MENDTVEKNIKRIIILVTIKRKKIRKAEKSTKQKIQKRSREYYKNFSENEKISKRSYGNNRNKNMTDTGKKKRKKYTEN